MNIVLKNICLTLILTIIYGGSLVAQSPALQDSTPALKYTFSQFGDETWRFIKSPGKWNGGDYLKIGLIGASTFLIMETVDKPVREIVLKNNQNYYHSLPVEFGRVWGELYSPLVFFGGFAIHSLISDNITSRKIAYEIGQASIYAGVINYILKLAIGRARPYQNDGQFTFHPFSSFFNQDDHSMPGGHSTAAFVISTVLSRNAKQTWLKILAYVPAVMTFASRVYQGQHWTSDDFLGAAFGYAIATWVVDQHESTTSPVEMSSVYPLTIRIAF
jgi:membrane-associated phospholipid phosphatase